MVSERLYKAAQTLDKTIQQKRNSSTAQQRPTARRMRIIDAMEREADILEQLQALLRGLARAHDIGIVPSLLAEVKTKAAVELLCTYGECPKPHYDSYSKVLALGLNEHTYDAARVMLLALAQDVPQVPDREREIVQRERALVGLDIPGYFPTPQSVITRMLWLADIQSGMRVLEPSAGKGSIADQVRSTYPDARLDVIECNWRLREILELKGHVLIADDFMEFDQPGIYNRIIANPPFEQLQDVAHVQHMYDLLKHGGKMVSVMSASPFFQATKKAVAFRTWLDAVGGIAEKLPDGAFLESDRPTGVSTYLVCIHKDV
jgi:phospholipid N-methyltransferase